MNSIESDFSYNEGKRKIRTDLKTKILEKEINLLTNARFTKYFDNEEN